MSGIETMKFDQYKYWKHRECFDVFIAVRSVAFDDDGKNAILHVTWCTQTNEHWFFTIADRLKIVPGEYDNWLRYTPEGSPKL